MNPKAKLIFRYLIYNPSRTVLILLALIIGLWGMASMAVSFIILKDDLNKNYQQTLPAHVSLTSKDFSKLDLDQFRKKPEVQAAEYRDLSMERIEVFPNQWVPLMLFAVDDFKKLNLAKYFPHSGKFVPDPSTLLVERNGTSISDFTLNSLVRIRAGSEKVASIKITGFTFDPGVAPSSMDHLIYAYTDKKTFSRLTGKQNNQRLILRFKNVETKKDIRTLTRSVLSVLKEMKINVTEVSVQDPNEHPHQFQLNSILALQGGIGMLSFIMGVVLVWQLMSAVLASQIRQIGIFKTLGASPLQIFSIYSGMVIALGAIASATAIPLATWSGFAFANFVSNTLNFELLTTSLSLSLYLYIGAVGILLPLLATLPILAKSSKISVVDALNDYGIQLEHKEKPVKKNPFSSRYVMIFRNTLRRKSRLIVTVSTMAIGVSIFSTGFNLKQSLIVLLNELDESYQYDIQLNLAEPISKSDALEIFSGVKNLARIETWSGGSGVIQSKGISTTPAITIVALPRDTNLMNWTMIQGRWLQANDEIEMVVNQRVLETLDNPLLGEIYSIDVNGKLVVAKLVGVIKQFARPTIYMDKTNYDHFINSDQSVNNLMFVAKDNEFTKILDLRENIEKVIDSTSLHVSSVMSQADLMKALFDHLNIILSMISFLALLVLVIAALGMASAMGINIIERTKEIGVLRAIGATPRAIYGLFLGEGFIITGSGLLLGFALSWPMSIKVSAFFGNLILGHPLDFSFSYTGIFVTITLTFFLGSAASLYPARNAIKIHTRDALNYE